MKIDVLMRALEPYSYVSNIKVNTMTRLEMCLETPATTRKPDVNSVFAVLTGSDDVDKDCALVYSMWDLVATIWLYEDDEDMQYEPVYIEEQL
jgi:hypothetical protein